MRLQPWTGGRKEVVAHGDGKVVNPRHRPLLPPHPADIPGTDFCYRLSGTNGHHSAAVPMTKSVIEPATFRFTAQCLNQLRRRVPQASYGAILKPLKKMNGIFFLTKLHYYEAFLSPNATIHGAKPN